MAQNDSGAIAPSRFSQSLCVIHCSDFAHKILVFGGIVFQSSKAHLEEAQETYFQHQSVAIRYGFCCLKAALMAFVHGVIPGLYKTGASDLIKKLCVGRDIRKPGVQVSE